VPKGILAEYWAERGFVVETSRSGRAERDALSSSTCFGFLHMLRVDARRTYPRSVKRFGIDRGLQMESRAQIGARLCRRDKSIRTYCGPYPRSVWRSSANLSGSLYAVDGAGVIIYSMTE
jgi:hypothetical protein